MTLFERGAEGGFPRFSFRNYLFLLRSAFLITYKIVEKVCKGVSVWVFYLR